MERAAPACCLLCIQSFFNDRNDLYLSFIKTFGNFYIIIIIIISHGYRDLTETKTLDQPTKAVMFSEKRYDANFILLTLSSGTMLQALPIHLSLEIPAFPSICVLLLLHISYYLAHCVLVLDVLLGFDYLVLVLVCSLVLLG
jgi:hypothetical protein